MENELNEIDQYYDLKIKNNLAKPDKIESVDSQKTGLGVVDAFGMTLKNRYVVSVMTDNEFFEKGTITERYFEFYRKIAKGDAGLILTGGFYDIPEQNKLNNYGIKTANEQIDKWVNFLQEIHTFDSKIMLTIKPNFGRCNPSAKLFDILTGSASFNKNYNNSALICGRLSDGKCNEIISKMKRLSGFVVQVGFDGIVIDRSEEHTSELQSPD